MENWTGTLQLEAEERFGKTVAKNIYFQGALKIMRPVYHDDSGQVCYYILNPGGGYLDGDRYKMKIALKENARMTLTTQSATKVYKTPKSYAYQETEMILNAGSYLEYIPDPLIGYRDARYKQKNVIHMDKSATLLYSDIITPGWSPEGDQFSYDMLQLINEIYVDNQLAVFDHIKLTPGSQGMTGMGLMEGYSHLGSMIVIGDKTNEDLIDQIYQVLDKKTDQFTAGISMLPVPGFTIRVLANLTQTIERIFTECHHIISEEWFGTKPHFLRKY
ncbi:urease accessory protein UreD [Bacillus sp. FJAT-29790]|uniref:urease accessory protein UreD n=1 Tax=Bacillus sp. FJAT-29790 TaxID=1895002 RepID=UPI001C238F7D|nr:urease accessory protein UreD [Bacillus sp. FJAT-29790]MBU8880697.1 urease accessory protein UreD [Bacillus sp. FJAT-29790]